MFDMFSAQTSTRSFTQIFKIFDSLGLKYYVFAGALVGFVRDGMLPPWLDDMDIMVFKEHKNF